MKLHRFSSDHWELESPGEVLHVMQSTDTHFHHEDEGDNQLQRKARNQASRLQIDYLLSALRPDLILHTGDLEHNLGTTLCGLEYFLQCGVPWVLALGNHDTPDGSRMTNERELAWAARNLPPGERQAALGRFLFGFFTTNRGPAFAYRVDLRAAGVPRPGLCLFIFDSGNDFDGKPKCISDEQQAWFQRQIESDREGRSPRGKVTAPIVAAVHIPLKQFHEIKDTSTGMARERDGNGRLLISSEADDGSMFRALKASGRVLAVLSGHDHWNSFYGRHDGIELIYGRATGFGGYPDPPHLATLKRGCRLLTLNLTHGTYSHTEKFAAEVRRIWNGQWTQDWSSLVPFEKDGRIFLFSYKGRPGQSEAGRVSVDAIADPRRGSEMIWNPQSRWTTGWTAIVPFHIGKQPYLLSYKSGTGDVAIDRIDDNVASGMTNVYTAPRNEQWTTGWTSLVPWQFKEGPHILRYKAVTGEVRIDRLSENGLAGVWSPRNNWTEGWTSILPFVLDGWPHLLSHKAATGEINIDRINDGAQGTTTVWKDHGWKVDWKICDMFVNKGVRHVVPHILTYDPRSGEAELLIVNPAGQGMTTLWTSSWDHSQETAVGAVWSSSSRWTHVVPLSATVRPILLAYNADHGDVAFFEVA